MTEHASAWNPVPDVTDAFGSISFAFQSSSAPGSGVKSAHVILHGSRNLELRFSKVVALHYEDECPGNFPLPANLPRLNSSYTFPLLKISNSRWAAQWPMWPNVVHYALISMDDIVHVLADPTVEPKWGDGHAV